MVQGDGFVLIVIAAAFVFEFINGFHDASNSIATIVATRVLSPRRAVLWAALFNCVAFLFFHLNVADFIANGLIHRSVLQPNVIFSALLSAIFWGLLTWYYGFPASSTQALIGGLAGSALVQQGLASLDYRGFFNVALGWLFAPVLAVFMAWLVSYSLKRVITVRGPKTKLILSGLQLLSSALLSLTHGANDAQKTMGLVSVLLFSGSWLQGAFFVPFWVVVCCQLMISLGTLAGGWRIVRTLGTRITPLTPLTACVAESSTALIVAAATDYGIPLSTSQTVTAAVAGVGLSSKEGPHWALLRSIALSWLFTLPITGLVAALINLFWKQVGHGLF